jgi:hypothetical protein
MFANGNAPVAFCGADDGKLSTSPAKVTTTTTMMIIFYEPIKTLVWQCDRDKRFNEQTTIH